MLNNVAKDELYRIIGIEQGIDRDNLICETDNTKRDKIFDFQKSKTI